jgi:endonuclease VIII
MPKGHILHRLAQDQEEMVGHVVTASSPQGRFAAGAAKIDGGRLELVEAYGKHLHQRYHTGARLHVHLGMQGKWLRLDPGNPPRNQVRLRLADCSIAWDPDEVWRRLYTYRGALGAALLDRSVVAGAVGHRWLFP